LGSVIHQSIQSSIIPIINYPLYCLNKNYDSETTGFYRSGEGEPLRNGKAVAL
jgi:hypothetical protein